MKLMVYTRPKVKSVIVEASRKAGLSLSSFIIRASIKQTAAMCDCEVTDLIPPAELEQYV